MKKSLFSLLLTGSLVLTSAIPLDILAIKPKAQKLAEESAESDCNSQNAKKALRTRTKLDIIGVAITESIGLFLSANAARLWHNQKPFSAGINAAFATSFTIGAIVESYRTYLRYMKPEETESKMPKWLIEWLLKPKTYKPIKIAKPFPGPQLRLNGIPQLPGFYHMVSDTPVPHENGYCSIDALYNICLINEKIVGNRPSDQEFFEAQKAIVKDPAHRTGVKVIFASSGIHTLEISSIIKRLKLPITLLPHEEANTFHEYTDEITASFIEINKLAREWHNSTGPRVAHFLCCIPAHAFAISVIRLANGSQAMYLYDCLNEDADDIDHMCQHIDYIYDKFF